MILAAYNALSVSDKSGYIITISNIQPPLQEIVAIEALNGGADKSSKTVNKDGKVTLGEVKAYPDREMTCQARRRFSRDRHATVSGDLKTMLSAY